MVKHLYSTPARLERAFTLLVAVSLAATVEASQDHAHPASNASDHESRQTQHEHVTPSDRWQVMQDGVVFLTFNRQAKPRGATELVSQNWWMGMGNRAVGNGTLTFRAMLSLEPLTLGGNGYNELFQTGATHRGRPLTDHQHPHDFVMQLTAVWRVPLSNRTSITVAGGPVGEGHTGASRLYAPTVRRRESVCTIRTSHVRLDAHHQRSHRNESGRRPNSH